MSDEIPPVPPVPASPADPPLPAQSASTPEQVAPTQPPRKRRIWPFIVGGAVLLVVILGVAVTLILTTVLGGLFGSGSPSATVREFDKAFAEADCDLFKATTTEDFQQSFFQAELDCDAWEENAKALRVDGEYAYTIEIHGSTVSGDTAQVNTKEVDSSQGEPTTYELEYQLVKTNGAWLIGSIEDAG